MFSFIKEFMPIGAFEYRTNNSDSFPLEKASLKGPPQTQHCSWLLSTEQTRVRHWVFTSYLEVLRRPASTPIGVQPITHLSYRKGFPAPEATVCSLYRFGKLLCVREMFSFSFVLPFPFSLPSNCVASLRAFPIIANRRSMNRAIITINSWTRGECGWGFI